MLRFKKLNFLFVLSLLISFQAKAANISNSTPITIIQQTGENETTVIQHGYINTFHVPFKFHAGLACALSLVLNHNLKLFGDDLWLEIPMAMFLYGLPIFGVGKAIELSATELYNENEESISNPSLTFAQMEKIRKFVATNKKIERLFLYMGKYNLIDQVYAVGYENTEFGEQKVWVEEL